MSDQVYLDQLRARVAGGETLKYLYFWGHQPTPGVVGASCFSQWYEAAFVVDGQSFATAEHYMMAEKAVLFGDLATRDQIIAANNPGAAKAMGRKVKGFDEEQWLAARFAIVVRGNLAKFAQNAELGVFLQQTGTRILVEASPLDQIWGIGLGQADPLAADPRNWKGLNLLGFALMQVRSELGAGTHS
jgi:ribA/ribD-fused uncharacterized protein